MLSSRAQRSLEQEVVSVYHECLYLDIYIDLILLETGSQEGRRDRGKRRGSRRSARAQRCYRICSFLMILVAPKDRGTTYNRFTVYLSAFPAIHMSLRSLTETTLIFPPDRLVIKGATNEIFVYIYVHDRTWVS